MDVEKEYETEEALGTTREQLSKTSDSAEHLKRVDRPVKEPTSEKQSDEKRVALETSTREALLPEPPSSTPTVAPMDPFTKCVFLWPSVCSSFSTNPVCRPTVASPVLNLDVHAYSMDAQGCDVRPHPA